MCLLLTVGEKMIITGPIKTGKWKLIGVRPIKRTPVQKDLHMAVIRYDEPPAPVVHVCASCMQKEGRREEHPER